MPKANINKKEYRIKDIGNWVVKWLKQAKKREQDLADELGISQPALSYKISHNAFSYADMLTIYDFLNVPDDEILFVSRI